MTSLLSLRVRIVMACVLFGSAVAAIYSFLVLFAIEVSDDELLHWHIANEVERRIANQHMAEECFDDRCMFVGTEEHLLKQLAGKAREDANKEALFAAETLDEVAIIDNVADTEQGYKVYEVAEGSDRVHVVKAPWEQGAEEPLYIFYILDVADFDPLNVFSIRSAIVVLIGSIVFVAISGFLVGRRISKRVIAPLSELRHEVDSIDSELETLNANRYFDDEVGHLANRINAFVGRIKGLMEREKAFSRDVSHELRTPVTSSQMALELAKSLPEGQSGKMADLLMRMDRANTDMRRLIETFLFLGRENDVADCGGTFDLNEGIQLVIENNSYLLTEETSFVNALKGPVHIKQPEKYVSVILDNLVRNAAQNTVQGRIVIGASHDMIFVEDTGVGFPEGHEKPAPYQTGRSDGMGLGLNIVARICQLQNWQFNIESRPSQGSRVSVFFS